MEQEIWKPVVNYEGFYEVSNLGRVKSVGYGKERLKKPTPAKRGGYLQVGLCKNGNQETCQVHQLVMQAFGGKCPDGCEVDHYDWNPSNNKLENLSYQPKEVNRTRHSPEWYKNTAEAAKRRAADPEWQRKNAEANKKKAQDPEWQKNHAEGCRKACCKPVDQYTLDGTFVKRWPSATVAARELGINHSHISECCNEKLKTARGFIWRFAD